MSPNSQAEVLVALLGPLESFAQAVRNCVACCQFQGAGFTSRAAALYDSLAGVTGDEAVDFVEALPACTRLAVENLLDALLYDASKLDAVLESDVVRGTLSLSHICVLICAVTEAASEEFGREGVDVDVCDAFRESLRTALQQLGAV